MPDAGPPFLFFDSMLSYIALAREAAQPDTLPDKGRATSLGSHQGGLVQLRCLPHQIERAVISGGTLGPAPAAHLIVDYCKPARRTAGAILHCRRRAG